MNRNSVLILMTLGCLLFACTRRPGPVPEPVQSPGISPPELGAFVARLASMEPEVSFRRKNDLIFEKASSGLMLYQFDAVQTHEKGRATALFKNGSRLELKENTFIIINYPDTGIGDRALLRGGALVAETDNELSLQTTAALVKVRAQTPGKRAKANVAIEEGKFLSVVIHSGTAELQQKSGGDSVTSKTLLPGESARIPAPPGSDEFGDAIAPRKRDQPTPKNVATITPAKKPQKIEDSIELLIEKPANNSEVQAATVLLSGKLSGGTAEVLVNGAAAGVDAAGNFSTLVSLEPGANSILIQMVTPSGSSTFRQWIVIRKD